VASRLQFSKGSGETAGGRQLFKYRSRAARRTLALGCETLLNVSVRGAHSIQDGLGQRRDTEKAGSAHKGPNRLVIVSENRQLTGARPTRSAGSG